LFAVLDMRAPDFLKGKQNFSVVSCSERAGGGAGLILISLTGKKWRG